MLDENKAELLGIMLGDGCLSRTGGKHIVYISGHKKDDEEYHRKTTVGLFKKIFDKDVSLRFRNDENTLFIRFSDQRVFKDFENEGMPVGMKYGRIKIPYRILTEELFNAFIRGLFDTDGTVVLKKQSNGIYPRIEITSKSRGFLRELLIRLEDNGYYGSVSCKGRGYRLELPGRENLGRWIDKIGSNNPKHLRKISASYEYPKHKLYKTPRSPKSQLPP